MVKEEKMVVESQVTRADASTESSFATSLLYKVKQSDVRGFTHLKLLQGLCFGGAKH